MPHPAIGHRDRSRRVAPLMLTRPAGLSDELLAQALAGGWGITPAAISYLAVGYGSHHWRTTTIGGARWFMTVDDLAERLRSPADTVDAAYHRLRSALLTARALRESGASFAVTPVAAANGDVLHRVGGSYALAVYPFVDGRAREFGDTLSPADLAAILPLITAVHGAPASVRDHARATGRDILPPMLELYRLTWELSDIVGCLTRFTGDHGDTVTDRADWAILNRSLRGSAE